MKIDNDLARAIRAAEKAQPNNYEIERVANAAAISDLLKRRPSVFAKLKQADAIALQREELSNQERAIRESVGINCDRDRIYNETAFVKAGGKLPPESIKRWKYDRVMAELAAASPKDGQKLLKKYGINWE